MKLLIKNALISGKNSNIEINDEIITNISYTDSAYTFEGEIFDAQGMNALPSFFNTHTHSAMTLLRGYADDISLMPWLQEKIWPAEAKLTEEDVYWGAKLACIEMIKSGTTFFNDMYWHPQATAKAAEETGIRCALSGTFIENGAGTELLIENFIKTRDKIKANFPSVIFTIGPHAIYTVSPEIMEWSGKFSHDNKMFIHTHISETEKEYTDCLARHQLKPVFYLDKMNLLNERTILAHSVWLDDDEIELLGKRKVNISYNPVSNMKLSVGKAMDWEKLQNSGAKITLGTDGCSSNNNLNMMESMKIGSLLQKFAYNDPCRVNAREMYEAATINGAAAFGIKAGKISQGYAADMILIRQNIPENTPGFSICSDLVYSMNSEAVDTVLCRGKFLMKNRFIPYEEETINMARKIAEKFEK